MPCGKSTRFFTIVNVPFSLLQEAIPETIVEVKGKARQYQFRASFGITQELREGFADPYKTNV